MQQPSRQFLQDLLAQNTLLRILHSGEDFTLPALKRLYRILCKRTHPDLAGNTEKFQTLQLEYEEALQYLEALQDYRQHLGNMDIQELRRSLYMSLHQYTVSGLHSFRIRLKPELKSRNTAIIRDVLYWANLYDSRLVPIFARYNQFTFQNFVEWERDRFFRKGRRLFLQGLRSAFEFQRSNSHKALRTALSYLKDAEYILNLLGRNPVSSTVFDFAHWLASDLVRHAPPGFMR